MSFSTIPVVDIAGWQEGGKPARAVAAEVHRVCAEVGFLYITGHGIEDSVRAEVFDAAHRFFAMPASYKNGLDYQLTGRHRGYVRPLSEAADPAAAPDVKEAFHAGLVVDPGEAPAGIAAHIGAPNLWPPDLPDFRRQVTTYLDAMLGLSGTLFRIFAAGLGAPEDSFIPGTDRPIAHMKLLRYPSTEPDPAVFGIGAHCDAEALTILAQDDVGGLQVRNSRDAWIDAPPIEGTFVVNIGKMLSRWTNGVFAATPHRVINTSGRERYSIPFFFAPSHDTQIAPLPACVTPERPTLFAPINAGTFLTEHLKEIYG